MRHVGLPGRRRAHRVLATAGLLVLPVAARAAQGMPQLEFNNPLILSQVVWLAIIFFALYVLLARWGLPQVASVLATREATIRSALDAAHGAQAQAQRAVRELTDATARARAEAQASINRAADEAKRQAAAQAEQLNGRLEEQLRASEASIAQARTSAMNALRQVATETAITVVGRLTGHAADQGTVERAVGAELAARGQA